MATEAQIEANRRNAGRSTGPRTQAGKDRSRLNAVDHGGRAMLPVLPGENPGEYETKSAAWRLSIKPRNPSEEFLIDRIVSLDLQSKRIDRAQTARLSRRMYFGFFEEGDKEDRMAIELGQKLFNDARGHRAQHGLHEKDEAGANGEATGPTSDDAPFEDHPMFIVHQLQTIGAGCQWLLEQWARLRDLLERGLPWIASDQLKAVRLLGRQPIEAVDSLEVARVYLASHVLLKQGSQPFQAILSELSAADALHHENDLNQRGYGALAPNDETEAREMLLEIVARATAVLEDKAGVLRDLAEIDAATAADRLSWDDTPEGERLRRYELTCKRASHKMFELLLEVRRTGRELDFATNASLGWSVPARDMAAIDLSARPIASIVTQSEEPVSEPVSPNEPNLVREKAPNEPNSSDPAASTDRRAGHKITRLDTPRGKVKGNERGTGLNTPHRSLYALETGRESPLLDMSAIFGSRD
jgi:hypothetical protein